MDTPPPDPTARLNTLVQECVDQWPQTGGQIVEDLCLANPDLASALRRRMAVLQRTGFLSEELAPRSLGEFDLVEQLGSGGMGVVYRAEQRSLRREVAVKVIRPDLSFFADSRQRFVREVNAVARLHHDGIVPVYVAGEDRGVLYYAMELVPGCTLARALLHLQGRDPAQLTGADLIDAVTAQAPADGEVPPLGDALRADASWVECCLRIARRVAEALEHAHGRGVLHRDVKPSNVMITPEGRVLLLDFGLASTDSDARITRSGAQLGSLAYMAPEQVRGEVDAITARTDVYGTGLLLRELLTLTQPYLQPNSEATRQAVLAGQPGSLRARNRAVPTDVELVVGKAMELDPTRRYASAAEFARDVGNVLELRPIEARAPGPWLRARRAAQRHPVRTLSIAFAAALLLGVFPLLYASQRAARVRVEAALGDTKAALARAESSEAWARASFGKAREAVDHFLTEIGEFRAVDIPLLEKLRSDALAQAAALYEALLRDPAAEGDASLARDRARTLFSLAQVQRELGRGHDAEPVLRRVLAACAATPNDPSARRLAAAARSALGAVLLEREDDREAEALLRAADDELRALVGVAASGGDHAVAVPAVARDSAQVVEAAAGSQLHATLLRNTVHLAKLRVARREVAAAAQLFRDAVALAERMPPGVEVARARADAHHGLGALLAGQSQPVPAVAEYQLEIAARRELVARAPSAARLRAELASALQEVATTISAWHADRLVEALGPADEAAELFAALVRDFPQQSSYQVSHGRARIVTASLRSRLARGGDAERDLGEAIAGLERVRAELPRESGWRLPLGFARYTLAQELRRAGRHADADAELLRAQGLAEELLRATPNDLELRQQVAEAVRARSESPLLDAEQALALAREAYEAGRAFLPAHRDDARLYATAFRGFSRLIDLLGAQGDVAGMLACVQSYREAEPYKWLCQLTLARAYLLCRGLTEGDAPAAIAQRERCLAEAKVCVHKAAEHVLKSVARIENDPTFAPLLLDPEIVELVRRAAGK